ncbi:type IV conjugative transfer system lipoprotein TraV [Turicimonas muris]|uniref:type IV conjugative transfer system lipoprotein TraV n=1 Tax=Turicimonas muris TaxID=1796652 RepID=UPI0023F45F2E|nr:type IV conjugative transfer system lipoprotein TraV [Turicimonas muris]
MRTIALLTCLLPAVLLTGCGSLTGFSNAQTDFSCGDLTGKPSCRNISDVYVQTQKEAEDAQNLQVSAAFAAQAEEPEFVQPYFEPNREQVAKDSASAPSPEEALLKAERQAASAVSPITSPNFAVISPASPWRSPETIFRVWIAPFTDTEGDLHDQRYMYVKVLNAGWSVPTIDEMAKPRSPYRPVYPLSQDKTPEPSPKKPNPLDVLKGRTS